MKYAASLITGPKPSVCQSTTVQVAVVEEHVVEPVVAVDEAERGPPIRVPGVGGGDEALADLGVLGGDPVPVALEEAGQQRGQQCLVERVRLVQPVGRGEREVAEHRRVDPRQGHHRDPRLVGPAAGDLIALHAVARCPRGRA